MTPEESKEQLRLNVAGEAGGQPADIDIVRAAVGGFFAENYDSDRNPAHSERVTDILRDFGYDTEGMKMAVLLHDVIDHGIVNPKNSRLQEQADNLIVDLYEKVEDKNLFIYAVGCGISAANWEGEVAESWRTSAFEKILEFSGGDETDMQSGVLMGAIKKNNDLLSRYPDDIKESVLKSNRMFDLDTRKLRGAMTKLDVEGLLIKAAEIMDNLEHPPAGNPASTWRDCTEVFNCYGPALDLFDFKEIASELRGKALEFYFDDPDGSALHQRQLSEKYFDDVAGQIKTGVENSGHPDEEFVFSPLRIKSEGSIRQKLHDDGYFDMTMVPDGLGSRVIVPDDMSEEDLEKLARDIQMSILDSAPQVDAMHPRGEEDPFEIRQKKSGYSAIHLTFVYHTPDGAVPYELQFVTNSQHLEHEVGKPSHMLFKVGITEPHDHVLRDMKHIYARAHHLQNQALKPELNPNTWAQIVKYIPSMNTPLHKAFSYNRSAGDTTVLMPPRLNTVDLSSIANEVETESELDAIFLPPDKLEVGHFFELISLIDPDLAQDERIINAVELLQSLPLKQRKDGEPTLEGHLLPTALNAAILAAISGEHWEAQENPTEYLSKTITSAMLHDVIEDTRKHKRKVTKEEISDTFGDEVGETVDSLSTFDEDEIEHEHVRRVAYSKKVAKNPRALLIKLSDRMQNHQTDLVRLEQGVDEGVVKSIFDYFAKTDIYFSEHFDELPDEYKRVKDLIWGIAKNFGYKPIPNYK